MASTSSTSSNLNRMAGLASGLDTENLVKAMAQNSLKRYNRKASKLQTLQWKQAAYREQISSLKSFSDKYLTTTSKNSIKLASNMSKKAATSSNSLVSATASGTAKAATYTITSSTSASKASLSSAANAISANIKLDFSKFDVEGIYASANSRLSAASTDFTNKSIDYSSATMDYTSFMMDYLGNAEFTDELKEKYGAASWDEVFEGFKNQLNGIDCDADNTDLFTNISKFATDVRNNMAERSAWETEMMTGDHNNITEALNDSKTALTAAKTELDNATKAAKAAEGNINGLATEIKVTLDGKTKTISINRTTSESAQEDFINGLNAAFGLTGENSNKFNLSSDGTLTYDGQSDGIHHTFSVNYNTNIGLANTAYSDVSAANTLGNANFAKGLVSSGFDDNNKKLYTLKINDKEFEFNEDTTITSMMNTINNSNLGIKMSFSTFNQSFKLEASETGANNDIVVGGTLGDALFDNTNFVGGKDSKITISGEDGIEATYKNSSNVYTFDGTSIDVSKLGDFKAGNGVEAIKITTTKDNSGVKDFIVNFINDYNKLIGGIYSDISTSRPKSNGSYYDPLTDEQKEEMSTEEIEKWEKQAKVGLLYQDNYLNTLYNELQSVMGGAINGMTLADMGIKSTSWNDNGKLSIDEDKLDKCLLEYGDKVTDFFSNLNVGLGAKLTQTVDKAIATTGKVGYLTGYAGTEGITDKKNALYNEITTLQKMVSELKAKHETEMERYWKKFSSLETYINRMNTQSSIFNNDTQ